MNAEFFKKLLLAPTTSGRMPIVSGILFTVFLSSFTSNALAHHSWGAIYNEGQPVSVTAVITGKPYRNPHDRVDATIVNESGETEEWKIEWRGRRGEGGRGRGSAVQYDLIAGDEVTIEGRTARDPNRLTIQMTKLTRISDGMTIEASLGRDRNGEGRGQRDGESRDGGRGNRQNQTTD